MELKQIDASLLKKAFLTGAQSLEAKKEWINELNVFPVPDGDTGTNMTLTIMSAAKEVAAIKEASIDNICKAISSGSLRGARGNSGVILSQLFRGFTKELKDVETINTELLAAAMSKATETAYKAVMKPKEGTILTVAKGMSDKATEIFMVNEDIIEFINEVIKHGEYVLSITPEMLPVLKQAGVVDSGGQGLMEVMKGIRDGLMGKEVDYNDDMLALSSTYGTPATYHDESGSEIKFGYCTEFIINIEKPFSMEQETNLKNFLESIGDSIVCVSDDDIVKVHVHTNEPGTAIQKALSYGSLSRMKIDNMREEHNERLISQAEKLAAQEKNKIADKEFGFISVSAGNGLSDIFKGLGADYIIQGGQTMNPSTEDMLNAISMVHAKTVFILPNNKNIILAAEQAAKLTSDKEIIVIPSRTVPQGITALINFNPEASSSDNLKVMSDEMFKVTTGQITHAVRNTSIDGYEIHQGDIMGIGDKGILAVGKSIEEIAIATIKAMILKDSELVSIYYGSDVDETDADKLLEVAQNSFANVEFEIHSGGQPIYYYMISVE